jgi:hypothetical protein
MKNRFFALPLFVAAAVTLSACNNEESINDTIGDPQSAELANAAPVAPPPMIKSSHNYRCKDNSLISVDFMTDDKTANLKLGKEGPSTQLVAPEAGQPFVSADGTQTITGTGANITFNGSACKTG